METIDYGDNRLSYQQNRKILISLHGSAADLRLIFLRKKKVFMILIMLAMHDNSSDLHVKGIFEHRHEKTVFFCFVFSHM